MASDITPPDPGQRDDRDEFAEPPPPREPVFPKGRPLRTLREDVELRILGADELRHFRGEGEEIAPEGEEGSPALRSPLGVRLPTFQGPLDLLLHLIKRDQIDIYDIPIGHITERYLSMLGIMQVLDLEVAGDFLVMAATLMRIKSRMLLPTWPEDEDEEDPRAELVRQLLEYRRFKEAAERLRAAEDERRWRFERGFRASVSDGVPVELVPLSQFDLIEVMKEILARVGEEFFYEVQLEDVTIEEKIALVMEELAAHGRVLFLDLVSRTPRRMHVVVTFMAILELARLGKVAVAQEANFGPMWLYPGDGQGAMAPAEGAEETVSPGVDDAAGRESETHGTT